MDQATRRIVQHTWTQFSVDRRAGADIFYSKLFELDPALQYLFKGDLDSQKERLLDMFNIAVRGLDQLDGIVGPLRELGRKHVAYGVVPAYYDTMRVALLFTLQSQLGAAWTPEVDDAWTRTYELMAGAMKEGALSGS